MSRRIRLLFLINSLNPGGAERQLCELVHNLDRNRFEPHVVVLYDPPDEGRTGLWSHLSGLPGVTLTSLGKRKGPASYAVVLPRLLMLLLRVDPDIVHGYLEGNLPLLLLGRALRKRVVWGIRRTSADQSKLDRVYRVLLWLQVNLSPFVDLVIFNSQAGLANHVAMGMRAPAMRVVPNGFDIDRFRPDPVRGAAQRKAWDIPPGLPLIGIVGRLDPVKDHATFLKAAARLAKAWPTVRFVCVGGGPSGQLRRLKDQCEALDLRGRVLWAGVCEDMTAVYNALTVLVLASTDEGFPNVLGEAMACGIPCVTTRVGDAALLVGETGLVVAPGDDGALSAAVTSLLQEPAAGMASRREAARQRICATYSLTALAEDTGRLLTALVPNPAHPHPGG